MTENRQSRARYSPIVDRKPWRLPDGARVAVWVIPNIEHFLIDRPSTSITAVTAQFVPDVLNHSWREFGVRVGIWRLMELMERMGIRGTVALNSDVCANYPRIIQEGNRLGWEWMGHGLNNSSLLTGFGSEDEERAVIREVRDTIAKGTGTRPRGWLGPALTETFATPDLLAEEGFEYVGDWVNDEQPYRLNVRKGALFSIPYSIEINDIPAFLDSRRSADEFQKMITDQFDVLYEDGAHQPRVMAIALHPFLIGHAFRIRALERALAYIRARPQVWFATGGEIVDWYKKTANDG